MKIICIASLLAFSFMGYSQSKELELSKNKILQIVFPETITSTKISLPQQISVAVENNVIYLQPKEEFPEANMTVITNNKSYYGFILRYNTEAKTYNVFISSDEALHSNSTTPVAQPENNKISPAQDSMVCVDSLPQRNNYKQILSRSGYLYADNSVKISQLYLTLKGIYVDAKHTYLRLMIMNNTNINYDIEYFAFIIRAKTKGAATTEEQLQIVPIGSSENIQIVKSKETKEVVFAFEKFTLNPEKLLNIDLIEKNGERNLSLEVKPKILFNSQNI